jgi:hypothetical protein
MRTQGKPTALQAAQKIQACANYVTPSGLELMNSIKIVSCSCAKPRFC